MAIPLFHVSAFTDKPFSGNPAAVCLLDRAREARWMQQVARDMSLSETAFLVPAKGAFRLRWFTPGMEVELCGHATLASAHVLWEENILPSVAKAEFETRSGRLTARKVGDWIELDFPAMPPRIVEPPPGLLEGLGTTAKFVGKNKVDYLVEVENEQVVRQLQPEFQLLKNVPGEGVIVTARSDSRNYDFVSRYFAPACGIDEDPVTGAAHCCSGPYWAERMVRNDLLGYQASARGGYVRVSVCGSRVTLRGQAITTLRGQLLV